MKDRPEVVLDKSYLQGASATTIHALCRTYRVMMPGALFFELMTTPNVDERRRCFAKFPKILNPVEIVEHVGMLLRFEARNQKPSLSLYERRHVMLFEFNAMLSEGTFQPTEDQLRTLAGWEREVEEEVDNSGRQLL